MIVIPIFWPILGLFLLIEVFAIAFWVALFLATNLVALVAWRAQIAAPKLIDQHSEPTHDQDVDVVIERRHRRGPNRRPPRSRLCAKPSAERRRPSTLRRAGDGDPHRRRVTPTPRRFGLRIASHQPSPIFVDFVHTAN
jgi:hypothetical protein